VTAADALPVALEQPEALGDLEGEGLSEAEADTRALREVDTQAEALPVKLPEALGLRERVRETVAEEDRVPVAEAEAQLDALGVPTALTESLPEGDCGPDGEGGGEALWL
jgi:hypothetical protein